MPLAENRITRQTRHVVSCYAVRDAALPVFDRIPCLETPKTRIQNCANAIWPMSCTAGPGRLVFRAGLFNGLLLTAPPAFFGLAFRSWLECDKMPGKAELISARARSVFLARPDGRVLGHGCLFRSPWMFLSHEDQTVRVQRVDCGRAHSTVVNSRA